MRKSKIHLSVFKLSLCLIGAVAASPEAGSEEVLSKTVANRSFIAISRIGSMTGGSSARSCVYYLDGSGFMQWTEEETDGALHGLRTGQGSTRPLLQAFPLPAPAGTPQKDRSLPQTTEHYSPKLAITSLSARGGYRSDFFEAAAVPRKIHVFVERVEAAIQDRPLTDSEPGLYARARRQLDFDPDIETLKAALTLRQLESIPPLSDLIAREMALIRIGPPGQPASLAKDLALSPGRALRVKVGALVYILQAYEFLGPEGTGRAPCQGAAPSPKKGME